MDDSINPCRTTEQPTSKRRIGLWLLGIVLAANLLDLIGRGLTAESAATSFERILFLVQAGVCGVLFLLLAGAAVGLRPRVRATRVSLPLRRGYERTTPMSLDLH